jgi:hypothetical protein
MEANFTEEIPKTQRTRIIDGRWQPIDGDFMYSPGSFIGKHMEIIFSSKDAISALQFGHGNGISKIVSRAIANKIAELRPPIGLLVDYKVIAKEMTNENIRFEVEITECKADCG